MPALRSLLWYIPLLFWSMPPAKAVLPYHYHRPAENVRLRMRPLEVLHGSVFLFPVLPPPLFQPLPLRFLLPKPLPVLTGTPGRFPPSLHSYAATVHYFPGAYQPSVAHIHTRSSYGSLRPYLLPALT